MSLKVSPSAVAGVSHYNVGIQWYGCSLPGQWGQEPQCRHWTSLTRWAGIWKEMCGAELHFQHNTPTLWNLVLGECCVGAQTLHSSLGFFVLISYFFKTTNYYAKLIWETEKRGFKTVSREPPSQLSCHLKIFPGWRQRIPTASWWQPAPGGTWRSCSKVSRL